MHSVPDLHGSTSVVAGAVRSSGPAAYDPWGALINTFSTLDNGVGGPGFAAFGSQGRITNQLGIITLGARAYNPVEGRFLSVDPIHGGCANPYVYGRVQREGGLPMGVGVGDGGEDRQLAAHSAALSGAGRQGGGAAGGGAVATAT